MEVNRPIGTSLYGLVILFAATALLQACTVRDSTIAEEEVVQTMNEFFTALSTADTTLLIRITTENFTLYEHEEIWNRDTLLSLMPAVEGRIWEIQDPEVYTEGDMAHIHYYNISRKPEGRSWLESALLLDSGDTLRIAFMHSTKLYLTPE